MEQGENPVDPALCGVADSASWRPVVTWTALAGIGLGMAKIAEWGCFTWFETHRMAEFRRSWWLAGALLFIVADVGAAGTLVAGSIGCLCRAQFARKLFVWSALVMLLLIPVGEAIAIVAAQTNLDSLGIHFGISWVYWLRPAPAILQRMLLPLFLWFLMSRRQSDAAFETE